MDLIDLYLHALGMPIESSIEHSVLGKEPKGSAAIGYTDGEARMARESHRPFVPLR